MSTILKILVPAVPPHNAEAYAFADALALRSFELPPNPRLLQFAAALTERYPCWSSGAYSGEAGRAACPWTETPLANCFRGDMGIIGITGLNPDVVPFVLRRAGAFALTVIDQQGGKVYRPATFCVAFKNVQKNVNTDAMVNKLMPLLKASREEVLTAIRTPDILLKCRLDYVTAKRFVATMDLIGCNCTIEKEVLVPLAGAAAAGISAAAAAAAAAATETAAIVPATTAAAEPVASSTATATTTAIAEPFLRTDEAAPKSLNAAIPAATPATGPELPIVPTTTATARLAMARFEVAEPDGRRRRGSEDTASPSWFARLFGKVGRG